jgi:glycosyltransferase involved in cell wall biosynthesis
MPEKIAIVHEWYVTKAGSEQVIEQLLQIFPQADLYSLMDFMPQKDRAFLAGRKIRTSFLQNLPFVGGNYRLALPLMPLAIEQFDLSEYDIIISNCHAVSKGVISAPDQLHISYIHTPIRYAWDMQAEYLQASSTSGLRGLAARLVLHYIRAWDALAANRPDILIANSRFIASRIQKTYRRPSHVIYPPVDTDAFTPGGAREDFYLAASRFVPYKRMDLIVKAFREMPEKRLVVIGDGPEMRRVRKLAGPNIELMGYQPFEVLRDTMRRCRAFIFAAREDFGITPLEAQACGAAVIAFGQGGVAETVIGAAGAARTGIFFREQTVPAVKAAVQEFEQVETSITAQACRTNAERFSNQRFREEFEQFTRKSWDEFRSHDVQKTDHHPGSNTQAA